MTDNATERRGFRSPWGVTLLAAGVLFITMLNCIRLFQSLARWEFLDSLPGVSPLYLALSGGLWTIAGIILILIISKPRRAGLLAVLAYATAYAIYYWLDLLLVAGAPAGSVTGASLPFKAGMTVLLLLFTLASAFSHPSRSYLRRET